MFGTWPKNDKPCQPTALLIRYVLDFQVQSHTLMLL
jgi:hypothetical protein